MNWKKRKCPGCNFEGGLSDFSPAIQISPNNFRIFHMYAGMRGPLYCNQCKRRHLLKIANLKKLNNKEKKFLQMEIKKFKTINF